ncbi:MAG: hypothetical protein K1X55_14815 [Chitinophagales bacterium]|nr:hypothetical protein [Chitinophagales bacterium]
MRYLSGSILSLSTKADTSFKRYPPISGYTFHHFIIDNIWKVLSFRRFSWKEKLSCRMCTFTKTWISPLVMQCAGCLVHAGTMVFALVQKMKMMLSTFDSLVNDF